MRSYLFSVSVNCVPIIVYPFLVIAVIWILPCFPLEKLMLVGEDDTLVTDIFRWSGNAQLWVFFPSEETEGRPRDALV